jgi:hypothetical protein
MSRSESSSSSPRRVRRPPWRFRGLDEPDVPYMVGIFSSAGFASTPATPSDDCTLAWVHNAPLCASRSSSVPVLKLSEPPSSSKPTILRNRQHDHRCSSERAGHAPVFRNAIDKADHAGQNLEPEAFHEPRHVLDKHADEQRREVPRRKLLLGARSDGRRTVRRRSARTARWRSMIAHRLKLLWKKWITQRGSFLRKAHETRSCDPRRTLTHWFE